MLSISSEDKKKNFWWGMATGGVMVFLPVIIIGGGVWLLDNISYKNIEKIYSHLFSIGSIILITFYIIFKFYLKEAIKKWEITSEEQQQKQFRTGEYFSIGALIGFVVSFVLVGIIIAFLIN